MSSKNTQLLLSNLIHTKIVDSTIEKLKFGASMKNGNFRKTQEDRVSYLS